MTENKINGDPRRGIDPRVADAGFGTICLHAGEGRQGTEPYPTSTPVYQSTAYYFDHASGLEELLSGGRDGYAYSRWGSVTNTALESALSTVIGGGATLTTSSGMAANFAALQAAGLRSGKTALVSKDIYGNTYDVLKNHFMGNGARCVFTDFTDLKSLGPVMAREKPDVVFFEVLANPMLAVVDAPRVIRMAHEAGARVVVDNTFATPYLYHPFRDDADYETHSLTKYINGHGDVLGGSVTCRQEDFRNLETLVCVQGSVLSPDAARLVMRGLKTFPLRMGRHCANAKAVAAFLESRPEIERVRFPGLESHPNHDIAKRLFRTGEFGGMLCFDLKGAGKAESFRLIDALRIVTAAGSLGDVKSLIVHPSSTTHHSLSEEEKRAIGIRDSTIRMSVGIEDPEDILEDMRQALETLD